MNRLSYLAVAAALFVSGTIARAGELDGKWRLKYMEAVGKTVNADPSFNATLTVEGNSWVQTSRDPRTNFFGRFTTNDQTSPRQIDLFSVSLNRLVSRGIYEVQGNTLRVCRRTSFDDRGRPSQFISDGKTGDFLSVYERIPSTRSSRK